MEINILNTKHKKILDEFDHKIQGFIYRVTEHETKSFDKYINFQPVKKNAYLLHNQVGDYFIDEEKTDMSEWLFMLPNYLLFAACGFASALKTKENEEFINEEIEELFMTMRDTIKGLEEISEIRKVSKVNKPDTTLKDIIKQKLKNKKRK